MVMPDELPGYESKEPAELVRLIKQRDSEIDTWRLRWKEACQRLAEYEDGHGRNAEANG